MEKDNDSMVVKQEAIYAPSEYSSSEAPPVSSY